MLPEIDWNAFLQGLMPSWWRKERFVRLLHVMVSPVKWLHARFLSERRRVLYEMSFTGQTMSLEGALNDRFDPDSRGIYISNPPDPVQYFIYRRIEAQPERWIYRKWSRFTTYQAGAYAISKGAVWQATTTNSNSGPSLTNTNWSYIGSALYIRRKAENQLEFDFVIYVPVEVVFNESEMRALVDRYRLAPKRYTIITY